MSFLDTIVQDARLIILRALADVDSGTLNSTALDACLRELGIVQPREWLFDQMNWLATMGAISVSTAGSVRVATLTEKGLDHVRRVRLIEGVGRPSLASIGVGLIANTLKGA